MPAIALTNDVAVVTAVANDVGVDNIFARQIIAFGRPGDIAFGISTSGNSTNVQAAFEQAKKQRMLTVGLAGYDGGNMARSAAVDYCIVAPSANIPRIQEAQATVYHTSLTSVWTAQPYILSISYGLDLQRGDIRGIRSADEQVRRGVFLVRLTIAPRLSRVFRPIDDADQPTTPLKGVLR